MGQRISSWRTAAPPVPAEETLADRYDQFLKWGELLARGDQATAREIVHDLCLQLSLSPPDFSSIANPDGYLYTCLRHLYLSRLARSSREATRFVSIADCDSVPFALDAGQRIDSLEVQNVLRRICGYSVWRKQQAKGFSYFILHFFHGYFHREIAELACLPVAAIYNKLKAARTELKAHLEDPSKLRFSNRESPPGAAQFWTAIPTPDLFRELRQSILAGRLDACLPEEELLAHYQTAHPTRVPCALLAHIVSCERCLGVIDSHFRRPTLKDRDSLDGFDRSPDARDTRTPGNVPTMLRSVHRRRLRILEHRPASLSIAVNGRIAAFHEVQGEFSLLSVRIEQPETAHFVEVFSEQDVRLALLLTEIRPPEGSHSLSQRTALSDDRWLELKVEFDGLGLNSEVMYFDPALSQSPDYEYEDVEEPASLPSLPAKATPDTLPGSSVPFGSALARLLRKLTPSPVPGWAFVLLCLMAGGGYLLYRAEKQPPDVQAILSRSIQTEVTNLAGRTEHQELSVEEIAADGRILAQGSVDLWKDGVSGRYMRRLYDSSHHLVAAEWRMKNGARGSWAAKTGPAVSERNRQLASNDFWMQNLSPRTFRAISERPVRVTATAQGYELSAQTHDAALPELVAATLMVSRRFQTVGEILRMRSGSTVSRVRLMQTGLEIEPNSAVPDSVYDPDFLRSREGEAPRSSIAPAFRTQLSTADDARLTELDIGVLYQLNRLGLDTGEPIEVERTPEHRVRVVGTISDDARRSAVVDVLRSLPDHQALDLHLTSQQQVRLPADVSPQASAVYNVVQNRPLADPVLDVYFESHPPSSGSIDAAVARFESDALTHAQRGLQNAYALDRLGSQFTAEELRAVTPAARRQWTEMVADHAAALRTELRALRGQLTEIGMPGNAASSVKESAIENPAEFAGAARHLLERTQALNRDVDLAFTSGSSPAAQQSPERILSAAADSIPLPEAGSISRLAARLAGTGGHSMGSETQAERQPSTPPTDPN